MNRHPFHPVCITYFVVAVVLPWSTAHGFQSGADAGSRPSSAVFARYIPDSAPLYIEVRNLRALDDAMRRAHAWNLLPLVAGGQARSTQPFSLELAVVSLLGVRTSAMLTEVMNCRVGVAAISWKQPDGAVWFVQLSDEDLLEKWFPTAQRTNARRKGPSLRFQTDNGFEVAVRGRIVAVSRRGAAGALFVKVASLMAGEDGATWEDDRRFSTLMADLPPGLLGTVAFRAKHSQPPPASTWSWLWSDADFAVVGIREGDGRLDVDLRAVSSNPREKLQLGDKAVNTIERLPDGTLLAWATMVDWSSEYDALLSAAGAAHPIASVIDQWFGADQFRADVLEKLGPRTVIIWGQDAAAGPSVPQIALMIELRDGPGDARALESSIVKGLGKRTATAADDRGTTTATTRIISYLGVRIVRLSLRSAAAVDDAQTGRLVQDVKPSFAVLDGWLVAALSPRHIRRVIAARRVSPSLELLRDLRGRTEMLEKSRTVGVIQPALAAAVMSRWMHEAEAGKSSFLGASGWSTSFQQAASRKIGIAVKVKNDPGVVEVVHVYPGAAAQGLVHVKDRIVGVDGVLLSLADSNLDLSKRLARSNAAGGPTLRVLRNGVLVDVVLPADKLVSLDPATAIRELAALGSPFEFASFSAAQVDEHRYFAHLALRFREPATH